MIQGGDSLGNGTGGPGYSIEGEFAANGFPANDISHKRGVISMARAQPYDSAGSQFFIMQKNGLYLDGAYAAKAETTENPRHKVFLMPAAYDRLGTRTPNRKCA